MDDNRTVHAFDAVSGAALWSRPISSGSERTFGDAGRVFVLGYETHAFDAASGTPLWTFESSVDTTYNTKGAVADGRVFIGSVRSGAVLALDAATGAVLWRQIVHEPNWTFRGRVKGLSVHEGMLYVVVDRPYYWNGYLQALVVVALDPATGRELWRYQQGDEKTAYQADGTLSFYGDLILYADEAMREVSAFDRRTRERVWVYTTPTMWAGPRQAPAVADGVAYVANGDGRVYALDAASGRLRWKSRTEHGSYASQVVCGEYVIAAHQLSRVYRKADGSEVGVLLGSGAATMRSRAVTDGRRLYFSASDGAYAYDCT